jgi:luciferase family oxidoreductase group 1
VPNATTTRVPLSVLDLAWVGEGQTSAEALQATVTLATRAEEWGYHRFWVAEHHNMPGVASTSPPVLIAYLLARTSTIRVGSGGVMLPNHPPLVVAEQFAMLEALAPGRVDLGIGRAPGTDPATAAALRRGDNHGAEDFPRELDAVLAMLGDPTREEPRPVHLRATPAATSTPQIWLLGSSGYSAQLAGLLGLPFAFAHHFSAHNTIPALELYRSHFRPSAMLDRPYTMVAQAVIVADTQEEAERQALPGRLVQLSLRTGRPRPLPTPEEAAKHKWTEAEREIVAAWPSRPSIGTPEKVRAELIELVQSTGADELMVTTQIYGIEERLYSYELLAKVWT